jgi:hypothetical protein
MIKALVPEIWPSSSNYHRPCEGTPFVHPATERTPELFYDSFGYCNPNLSRTQTVTEIVEKTPAWVSFLLVGGAIYIIWRYKKKLF